MGKSLRFKFLLAGLAVVCVALLLAETLFVKVQTTYVRKEPKFYSPAVATLRAGDSVTQLASEAGWSWRWLVAIGLRRMIPARVWVYPKYGSEYIPPTSSGFAKTSRAGL